MKMLAKDEVARETLENIGSRPAGRKSHEIAGAADVFRAQQGYDCWDLSLWRCDDPEGSTAIYEEWITKVVTALILCCYHNYDGSRLRKKRSTREGARGGLETTEDLDEFIGMCGNVSLKEAR